MSGQAVNETLARAIHEDYVRKQTEQGRTTADNPSMVSWDELPGSSYQPTKEYRRKSEPVAP